MYGRWRHSSRSGGDGPLAQATVIWDGDSLVLHSPYHEGFVAVLKATVPLTERRWDGPRRAWVLGGGQAATLVMLVQEYLGQVLAVPDKPLAIAGAVETRGMEARYIGLAKDRGDGTSSAFGWVVSSIQQSLFDNMQVPWAPAGSWSAVFPEAVLRAWFNAVELRPGSGDLTLYAILGVRADVGGDELRIAYRRAAKQWHPDVCLDEDAAEQFRRIQRAWELLRDPVTRAKYTAGLALQAGLAANGRREGKYPGYRTPLRCGLIVAEGMDVVGRFVASRIISWVDIRDGQGRVLVSSWRMGDDAPTERWV